MDRLAARLFGQQNSLDSLAQRDRLAAGVDIRGRRVERLAQRWWLRARENRRTVLLPSGAAGIVTRSGFSVGMNMPLVRLLSNQIGRRDAGHVVGHYFFDPVAIQEIQPPISLRRPIAQLDGQFRGIGGRQLALLQEFQPCALDFLRRDLFLADRFGPFHHGLLRLFERVAAADFGHQFEDARVVPTAGVDRNRGRLLRFDERLIEPARRRIAQHLGQDVQRAPCRDERRPECGKPRPPVPVADAAQHHRSARRPEPALRCRCVRTCASVWGSGRNICRPAPALRPRRTCRPTTSIALSG